jgi:hypothetical protein
MKRHGGAASDDGGNYLHGGAQGEVRTAGGKGISRRGNGGGKSPVQLWLGEETEAQPAPVGGENGDEEESLVHIAEGEGWARGGRHVRCARHNRVWHEWHAVT